MWFSLNEEKENLVVFQMKRVASISTRKMVKLELEHQSYHWKMLVQGHRAYAGHKKHITPNKREMLPYFLNFSLPESEFNRIIKELHQGSLGQPEIRTSKAGRDVIAYPVPECMCNDSRTEHVL